MALRWKSRTNHPSRPAHHFFSGMELCLLCCSYRLFSSPSSNGPSSNGSRLTLLCPLSVSFSGRFSVNCTALSPGRVPSWLLVRDGCLLFEALRFCQTPFCQTWPWKDSFEIKRIVSCLGVQYGVAQGHGHLGVPAVLTTLGPHLNEILALLAPWLCKGVHSVT